VRISPKERITVIIKFMIPAYARLRERTII
jgi:hypothetical protein